MGQLCVVVRAGFDRSVVQRKGCPPRHPTRRCLHRPRPRCRRTRQHRRAGASGVARATLVRLPTLSPSWGVPITVHGFAEGDLHLNQCRRFRSSPGPAGGFGADPDLAYRRPRRFCQRPRLGPDLEFRAYNCRAERFRKGVVGAAGLFDDQSRQRRHLPRGGRITAEGLQLRISHRSDMSLRRDWTSTPSGPRWSRNRPAAPVPDLECIGAPGHRTRSACPPRRRRHSPLPPRPGYPWAMRPPG